MANRIVLIPLTTILIIFIVSLSISLEFKTVNIDDESIVGNITKLNKKE
jgi:hypothetical protein